MNHLSLHCHNICELLKPILLTKVISSKRDNCLDFIGISKDIGVMMMMMEHDLDCCVLFVVLLFCIGL